MRTDLDGRLRLGTRLGRWLRAPRVLVVADPCRQALYCLDPDRVHQRLADGLADTVLQKGWYPS